MKNNPSDQPFGTLLVDDSGRIIGVNDWSLNHFNLMKKDVLGKELKNLFPDIYEIISKNQSQEFLPTEETVFNQRFGSLFVSCITIKMLNGFKNSLITISDNINAKKSNKKAKNEAHFTFSDLIGSSSSIREAKKIAEIASESNCNVMIIGESGSGKELFAQAIHNNSDRKNEPFVAINCAAIPKDLIYSELFGYVEGAFTGAKKGGTPGKFELSDKGTLFLDEIGELSNEMQAVLLRVLEEDAVSRLGSPTRIPIDVRIIAATNRDICSSVAAKQFRLDLYHRLCTVRIDIAPLRRRKEDIPTLAYYYLDVFNAKHNKNIYGISLQAMNFMQQCLWMGNVRELRNAIERGVIFCSSDEINISDLPKELMRQHKENSPDIQVIKTGGDVLMNKFREKLDEKSQIEFLLKKYNNNKSHVAKDLGIARATLYRKLNALGIS